MKTLTIIISLTSIINFSNAQILSYDDIFKTNKVYFYGYDFTHFKHVEAKRIGQGQQMKGFIFELIEWLNNKKNENSFERLLKKDSVIFTQEVVNLLNSKIKPESILD